MAQVVMTNSFRGGTGKSTIISNLASYLASLGMKTLIIDADIISPGVHAIFGLDKSHMEKTLTDFLNGTADIQDAVYDISESIGVPENTLLIVPASMEKGNIAELIKQKSNSEKLTKAIPKLKKEFNPDFIMIDTHPGLNDEFLIMSSVTDILLNIIRPDNQDYQGLTVSSDVAKKLKLKTYIIVNKVHPKIKNKKLQKDIEKSFKIPVAGILPLSEDIILSQSQFLIVDKYPDNDFSTGIYSVAETVFGVRPRDHLDIMHQLLLDIEKGLKVKQICSTERISEDKCNNYLSGLTDQGFITQQKDKYSLTNKGKNFLKKYKSIKKFVDNFRI